MQWREQLLMLILILFYCVLTTTVVFSCLSVQVDFSKLVVYHTKRNLGSSLFLSALHPDAAAGMDTALCFLEQQGATLVDFEEEGGAVKEMFSGLNAFRVWSALMSKHRHQPFAVTIREGLEGTKVGSGGQGQGEGEGQGGGEEVQRMTFLTACVELMKSAVDLSWNTFPAMLLAAAEFLSDLPLMESENRKQCEEGLRLKDELDFLLSPEYQYVDMTSDEKKSTECKESVSTCDSVSLDSEIDDATLPPSSGKAKVLAREHVLLLPSLPTPAPFHGESIMRLFDTSNTAFFNVMQLPVTAVPLGLTKPRSSSSGGGSGTQRTGAGNNGNSTSNSRRRQQQQQDGSGPASQSQRRGGQLLAGACNLPVGMQIVGGPHRDHVRTDWRSWSSKLLLL
jgi:hypothetical protein